ncbi:MAG: hypothetical protein ACYC3I_06850 [Gemmataceae bacterium]
MKPPISWPEGKQFAFTVFDDTDLQTLSNGPPIYERIFDLGFRTTKSVWPIRGNQTPKIGGATCEDLDYYNWVKKLQSQGFEIGMHNVTYHTSKREETLAGIERFHELFGHYPYIMTNHSGCSECIYWGSARLSGLNRMFYNLLTRFHNTNIGQGHLPTSPLFWGDASRKHIHYVRNFVFPDINTLQACPFMPYHDPERPCVNYWFASSEGSDVNSFVKTIGERNQDLLEEAGGACIMYTHFGFGFCRDGRVDPRFQTLMERLSKKNGWFVPVGELLDYLLEVNGVQVIKPRQRAALERKWLRHKIRLGRRT